VPVLRCLVSVTDSDGIRHSVSVTASSLFEAGAAGLAAFRREPWAGNTLSPHTTVRVEVQPPPIVHDVPLKAIERWINAPAISPDEQATKRRFRTR
jgi:hypothetical protein